MRVLVVGVCLLVLVSVTIQAGSLSAEELIELENILQEYDTVEELLSEGLIQLSEGLTQLSAGQIALAQGVIALHEGMGVLFRQTKDLDFSLTRIEDAYRAQQKRTRRLILILAGAVVAETAAIIVFK